jgi:hypothetical protein
VLTAQISCAVHRMAIFEISNSNLPRICNGQTGARENSSTLLLRIKPKHHPPMEPTILRVKRLSEFATLPVRASKHAAGYDLSRYYCELLFNS